MPLVPPSSALTPEGILNYGLFGSGKTEDHLTIGEVYRLTDTPGRFHIISTEYERVLASLEGHSAWQANTELYEVEDWPTLAAASDIILKVTKDKCEAEGLTPMQNMDWVVLDVAGPTLKWSRDYWMQENKNVESFRDFQADGGQSTDIQSHEWMQMERLYLTWFNTTILRFPGHRFVCAQADPIPPATDAQGRPNKWAPKETSTVKRVFGRGHKAVGYKELGAQMHTVLYKDNPTTGAYEISTVKDRSGRDYLAHEPVAALPLGFVKTYLQDVAKWSLT